MSRRRFPIQLAPWLLVITAVVAQTPPASSQRITPNFQNVDITVLAEAVGAATGITFIPDPRVRAQVSLINPRPMTSTELYHAFLSILQVHNFAAVRSGNVVKIVPDANVRTMPGNDLPTNLNSGSDEMVTTVIEAKNISANQLSAVLRPLVAQYGNLAPVPGTNSLIITDRASNVARIQRIVNRVDQASNSNVEVIPLQNSSAADVVRTLTALTGGAGAQADPAGGLTPRIVADDRSNSILLSGDPAQRLRIATWIAHLDTPVENGGDTQVRYLRYADAEKIAPKLKEQLTGLVAASGGSPAGGAASVERNVIIGAEPETNALIITAPPKQMRSLMTIIDKLDIRRAQVLVEAIIAEVNANDSADLGVNWAVFSTESTGNVPIGAFVQPTGSLKGTVVDLIAAAANPAKAVASLPLGTTFAVGRLRDTGINFGATIRALRSDSRNNVVATPSITTMDNQEAKIEIASEVPFITGQFTNTGSTNNGQVNPFTTVQRQKVGTILTITPQINGGDAILLNIQLESSELSKTELGDAGGRVVNTRTFKNTVLVEDGMTVVVGGLIKDTEGGTEQRVPFFSRIPLIGEAFRVRDKTRQKSNLMVFIRPKILADGVQTSFETNAKYNALREEQREQGSKRELIPLLPFQKSPLLPPLAPPPTPAASESASPKTEPKSAPAAPAPAPAATVATPEAKSEAK
jgi:general secretion pathway protein D